MNLLANAIIFMLVYLNAIYLFSHLRDGKNILAGVSLANVVLLSLSLAGGAA